MKKFLLAFLVVALGAVSAKTYKVTFYQPAVVGNTELRPGDYKLDLQDTKVVLKGERVAAESAVKIETAGSNFPATTVRYTTTDGKTRVQEIRLGGTNMKLVLSD